MCFFFVEKLKFRWEIEILLRNQNFDAFFRWELKISLRNQNFIDRSTLLWKIKISLRHQILMGFFFVEKLKFLNNISPCPMSTVLVSNFGPSLVHLKNVKHKIVKYDLVTLLSVQLCLVQFRTTLDWTDSDLSESQTLILYRNFGAFELLLCPQRAAFDTYLQKNIQSCKFIRYFPPK